MANLIDMITEREQQRAAGISDKLLAVEQGCVREINRKMPHGYVLTEGDLHAIGTWTRGMGRLHGLTDTEQRMLVERILHTVMGLDSKQA